MILILKFSFERIKWRKLWFYLALYLGIHFIRSIPQWMDLKWLNEVTLNALHCTALRWGILISSASSSLILPIGSSAHLSSVVQWVCSAVRLSICVSVGVLLSVCVWISVSVFQSALTCFFTCWILLHTSN